MTKKVLSHEETEVLKSFENNREVQNGGDNQDPLKKTVTEVEADIEIVAIGMKILQMYESTGEEVDRVTKP